MAFSLTGFTTVKREGFVLPGDFIATLNTDLKVGGLEETVTVSGESPVVDVQTSRQQRTLDNDLSSEAFRRREDTPRSCC